MGSEITVVKSRSYVSRVTKCHFHEDKVPPSRPQSYVFVMRKRHFRGAKTIDLKEISAMFVDETDNLFGRLKGAKFATN